MCCMDCPATPELKKGECPECGSDVDKDGETVEEYCSYSPKGCDTCGWRPCDGSC